MEGYNREKFEQIRLLKITMGKQKKDIIYLVDNLKTVLCCVKALKYEIRNIVLVIE